METTVRLPRVPTPTTPLGVGMATLMREPSRSGQQRLLDAAYDVGFRHFDTAPSYGLGAAERVLGDFLRRRGGDVTVGTKVGILARGNARLIRLIEKPARALLRRVPSLRGRATARVGSVAHARPDFSAETRTRSLEGSLRALRIDAIDLYLLHEPQPDDVTAEVVDWLEAQRTRGLVRAIGVASPAAAALEVMRRHPGTFEVVQTTSNALAPAGPLLDGTPAATRVLHSALALPLAVARPLLDASPRDADALSRCLGEDIRAPGTLARVLLAWAIEESRGGIVLVGSSSAGHLREATTALGRFDPARVHEGAAILRALVGNRGSSSAL